eukprot:CAMPEP_0118634642 /NCGR_PEP_ID=MMETSP0785-20121206/1656_1 /TAXON_ID=91992 /ORGANISM="Bolidomonas pacifica, Strain CCMP 1866" /LENGTH=180 /DNA_ID=CAMNT_0006525631 /DNA_START=132 /DNA_END=670 /DNA_ORIENTATION=-
MTCSAVGRFLTKFAQWCSKNPPVLDAAANVALTAFKAAVNLSDSNEAIRPFFETSSALRNLLSRAPQHFASNQAALAALSDGWVTSYMAAGHELGIEFEDRQALASGICRVLASLNDPAAFQSNFFGFLQPAIMMLGEIFDKASAKLDPSRGADEIKLLAVVVRNFKLGGPIINQGGEAG